MRQKMQQDLEVIGRPFGEFIPGGNAAKPGQVSKQIKIVKQKDQRQNGNGTGSIETGYRRYR